MEVSKVRTLIPALKDGDPGSPGTDARIYYLTSSLLTIDADENGVPFDNNIAITVRQWVRVGSSAATASSCVLKMYTVTAGVKTLFGPSDWGQYANISSGTASGCDAIRAELTDSGNNLLDSLEITVVKQGRTGSRAKTFYYYADAYTSREYTATQNQAPYVSVDWQETVTENGQQVTVTRTSYYMLIADTNLVDNVYIAPRTAAAAGIWELMESDFKWIIAEAIFASFAKLGSAIFINDWMISQNGTIDGVASTSYQDFDPSDPTGLTQGNFAPNFAVNLKTGKSYMNDTVIRGVVYATGGEFAGYIRTTFVALDQSDAIVTVASSITKYKLNTQLNVYGMGTSWMHKTVVLPNDSRFVGSEVQIYGLMGTQMSSPLAVECESGDFIWGFDGLTAAEKNAGKEVLNISWYSGLMVLVGLPGGIYGNSYQCVWAIKSFYRKVNYYTTN